VTNQPISFRSSGQSPSAEPGREGQLAASVAHEVNNPLAALLNILYMIESEATFTAQGRSYMKLAREEVLRISQIAHDAMDRIRDTAAPRESNVPALLGELLAFYHSRFESRGISILTRYCADGDLAVYAGPLRQVISNLLLNAADAMPEGGRLHARVSAAQEWAGAKRLGLRLTIADTGYGIPPDKLSKVFVPFFTTKGERGSGLGMSLIKDIVQKHSGVLRVRSSTKPGHSGSIFSIFLPAT